MPGLPTFATTPTLDQLAASAPPSPPAAPSLGFLDKLKLGWKQAGAQPDWGFNQTNWKNSALAEVDKALRQEGVQPLVDPWDMDRALTSNLRPGGSYEDAENQTYRTIFGQVAAVRQSHPDFLPDYASVVDKPSFDQLIVDRRKKSLGDVATQAPDGLGVTGFGAQIAHGAIDPISWLPIGGPAVDATSIGGRILAQALHGAAANAAITTVTEPLVREDTARLGEQRTTGDFFRDLFTSSAIGAGLGGTVEGLRIGREQVASVFQRRAAEPAPTGAPLDSPGTRIADTFAEIVPEDQRTPDEKAALSAVQRDAEVKASSPFVPGPAGDDAHVQTLDRAMSTINNPEAIAPRGAVKPVERESIGGPDDVDGTRFPARELLKAKIHAAEGDGANRSGGAAFGPYQFEPRTWVNLFKRRYPNDPRSFEQIAGLRGDPHLNDVLINDLISENAAALRHAGFDESAGNLYLAHVLGHDRAVTVLRADPNARLGDLLPDGYFNGNPFRRDDSAASLVHWAYGKMGDKGALPVNVAGAPAAAEGAEAIAAGEGDPQVQPSTGKFDVEALYGDVGMTDRPVLNPDQFASPEEHAAAQVRFERVSDAADGYAPVMSRAEAFAPTDHFDALRRYKGTVTADAMGEALGLQPGEVQRVVAAMQSRDPNSPFMLSRGRQPKFDATGNVVREGTEPGRVIRRPPKPIKANETMLEYLTRTAGGLKDEGGDLAAMGADQFHKAAPFRRKLIDNEHGQSLDDAFGRAIDAGYFPEHNATRLDGGSYQDLPDIADFHEAIDEELRGRPRYLTEDHAAIERQRLEARYGAEDEQPPESAAQRAERLFERTGHNQEAISEAAGRRGITLTDDQMVIDASDLIDGGAHPDEALDHAALESAYRTLDEAAAETGNSDYAIDPEERFSGDVGFPEERGPGTGDRAPDAGERGSGAVAEAEAQSRDRLAQSAHDPARGEFSDPVGTAAEAQADSTIHDAEMAAKADDGTAYRLDEEGGESDLQSILDEIENAQKAVDEMRGCLKPKGGEE